ncbi:Uncharacterised protein [Mycobacteroides abscessus]|uniref:hypothetical protein n=1 Tax=Mycobacteroides abscessus TaxID=36809 RepID=UPI0005E48FB5|nr:hypothetical protein [Mycobacteroides abscessus]CPU00355.1 Uncharacterised protein [Mycobacteroides abscessus]CPX01129.1 Uncharacterised protein [Mycobacteroides abscessus]CQA10603.1 Uncharacterised protein [Mycobacteroides abscessus]SKM06640.1 Uncharacterised protein [Mycobacteroides abscessus subsp. massiliense]
MPKITINMSEKCDTDAAADHVREVADLIENGYTSGYYDRENHWDSEGLPL